MTFAIYYLVNVVTSFSSYILAFTTRLSQLFSSLAFGVCALVAILLFFVIDSNAFVSDETSEAF